VFLAKGGKQDHHADEAVGGAARYEVRRVDPPTPYSKPASRSASPFPFKERAFVDRRGVSTYSTAS
jgi:hypothetical protein